MLLKRNDFVVDVNSRINYGALGEIMDLNKVL